MSAAPTGFWLRFGTALRTSNFSPPARRSCSASVTTHWMPCVSARWRRIAPGDAALELAVLADHGEDGRKWLGQLTQNKARKEAAVEICGAIDAEDVRKWLFRCASDPDLSAAAGRAMRTMYDIDFDDTDAFEADGETLGPKFAERTDGPVAGGVAGKGRVGKWRDRAALRMPAPVAAAMPEPGDGDARQAVGRVAVAARLSRLVVTIPRWKGRPPPACPRRTISQEGHWCPGRSPAGTHPLPSRAKGRCWRHRFRQTRMRDRLWPYMSGACGRSGAR